MLGTGVRVGKENKLLRWNNGGVVMVLQHFSGRLEVPFFRWCLGDGGRGRGTCESILFSVCTVILVLIPKLLYWYSGYGYT